MARIQSILSKCMNNGNKILRVYMLHGEHTSTTLKWEQLTHMLFLLHLDKTLLRMMLRSSKS